MQFALILIQNSSILMQIPTTQVSACSGPSIKSAVLMGFNGIQWDSMGKPHRADAAREHPLHLLLQVLLLPVVLRNVNLQHVYRNVGLLAVPDEEVVTVRLVLQAHRIPLCSAPILRPNQAPACITQVYLSIQIMKKQTSFCTPVRRISCFSWAIFAVSRHTLSRSSMIFAPSTFHSSCKIHHFHTTFSILNGKFMIVNAKFIISDAKFIIFIQPSSF